MEGCAAAASYIPRKCGAEKTSSGVKQGSAPHVCLPHNIAAVPPNSEGTEIATSKGSVKWFSNSRLLQIGIASLHLVVGAQSPTTLCMEIVLLYPIALLGPGIISKFNQVTDERDSSISYLKEGRFEKCEEKVFRRGECKHKIGKRCWKRSPLCVQASDEDATPKLPSHANAKGEGENESIISRYVYVLKFKERR